jgi:hypothetical protein
LHAWVRHGNAADGKKNNSSYRESAAGRHNGVPKFMQNYRTKHHGRKRKPARDCRGAVAGFTQHYEEKQKQEGDVDAQFHIGNPSGKNRPISHCFV